MKQFYLLSVKGYVGYDSYDSKVVRAENESEARKLANEQYGDEGKVREDPQHVDCEVLACSGDSVVILSSFNAG